MCGAGAGEESSVAFSPSAHFTRIFNSAFCICGDPHSPHPETGSRGAAPRECVRSAHIGAPSGFPVRPSPNGNIVHCTGFLLNPSRSHDATLRRSFNINERTEPGCGSPNRRLSHVRTYLVFYMSPVKHGLIRKSELTSKTIYALTNSSPRSILP